jgi:hypothetical protein
MKKRTLALALAFGLVLTGCGNTSGNTSENTAEGTEIQSEMVDSSEEDSTETEAPVSARNLLPQGNPTSINLSDIAEENSDGYNAWIKISTQYDPDLSMYSYDSLPADAVAVIVDFTVESYSETESTLYWGYQLTSAGNTYAVWDNTSPADQLTINKDDSYRIVFDASTALGGTIDTIESFQLVFPCSENTNTKVTIDSVTAITDTADLSYYTTGELN